HPTHLWQDPAGSQRVTIYSDRLKTIARIIADKIRTRWAELVPKFFLHGGIYLMTLTEQFPQSGSLFVGKTISRIVLITAVRKSCNERSSNRAFIVVERVCEEVVHCIVAQSVVGDSAREINVMMW